MWICACILISCEIMIALVQKESSIANFVLLQNDCQSPWGDTADAGQAGLREQGENSFHLKANPQGQACGSPSIQQALTSRSSKVMTGELLADLPELQNEMGGEKEYDDSMESQIYKCSKPDVYSSAGGAYLPSPQKKCIYYIRSLW